MFHDYFYSTSLESYENAIEVKNKLLSNKIHYYVPRIFDIEDTDELKKMNLFCKPTSFGFNKTIGQQKFPDQEYTECSNYTGINNSALYINRKTDEIYMTCPNNSGVFVYGPYDNITWMDLHILNSRNLSKIHYGNGPITVKDTEFALGKCSNSQYNYAQMVPVFNKTAYDKALKLKPPGKPRIIYFLKQNQSQ